jgi:hypothetical protein
MGGEEKKRLLGGKRSYIQSDCNNHTEEIKNFEGVGGGSSGRRLDKAGGCSKLTLLMQKHAEEEEEEGIIHS